MTINPHRPAPPASAVVQVHVNHRPVPVPGPVTAPGRHPVVKALAIKQAAIAAGVAISETFQLSVRRESRYKVLADHVEVELRPGLQFLAVAPDDNS